MTVTQTNPITTTEADQALKAKHAAMWASGDYSAVADEIVGSLGGILVDATDVRAGQHVLDVAAGTGTSAIPAARRGAIVTATDLTPELLEIGRQTADRSGTELTWQTADAENLPFGEASF
ncbi:MAG TPA: methyltransferase domain-containing protein, partial [Microlunatus sp.]|nr:methyltransferase domain-containing protein [Microlunatus sp.]